MKISKPEKTRQFVIENTLTLFNKKGYEGTSLADITNATGLSKGSIYGNFKNKEELAIEVFKYNSGLLAENITKSFRTGFTAYQKMIAIVEFYKKKWKILEKSGGCPMMNTAVESDDNVPFLKEQAKKSFTTFLNLISSILKKGSQNGEFKSDIDSLRYSKLFLAQIEGGILLAKTLNEPDILINSLDRIVSIVENEILA